MPAIFLPVPGVNFLLPFIPAPISSIFILPFVMSRRRSILPVPALIVPLSVIIPLSLVVVPLPSFSTTTSSSPPWLPSFLILLTSLLPLPVVISVVVSCLPLLFLTWLPSVSVLLLLPPLSGSLYVFHHLLALFIPSFLFLINSKPNSSLLLKFFIKVEMRLMWAFHWATWDLVCPVRVCSGRGSDNLHGILIFTFQFFVVVEVIILVSPIVSIINVIHSFEFLSVDNGRWNEVRPICSWAWS